MGEESRGGAGEPETGSSVGLAEILTKGYRGYTSSFPASASSLERQSVLVAKGTVGYTLARLVDEYQVQRHLERWDAELGYKMGLLIRTGQRVERLSYRGQDRDQIPLRGDPTVTADLNASLAPVSGAQWVGFVSTSSARRRYHLVPPNVVCFEVEIAISGAETGVQFVPVVFRHLEGSFGTSFLPGVWALPWPGRGPTK